jgi:hypothetical protein
MYCTIEFESPKGTTIFDVKIWYEEYQDSFGVENSSFKYLDIRKYEVWCEDMDVTDSIEFAPSEWKLKLFMEMESAIRRNF